MAAMVRRRLGDHGVMVGDRPSTDGALADGARLAVRAGALRDRRARPAPSRCPTRPRRSWPTTSPRSCPDAARDRVGVRREPAAARGRRAARGSLPVRRRPRRPALRRNAPDPRDPHQESVMPQPPDWNKYLDAGAEFVAMTRTQARQRAKELVEQGQLAQEQVQGFVDDLVDESRRRTDVLLDVVRKEIQRQVKTLGIATKEDLARLETQAGQADARRRRSRPRRRAKKSRPKKAAAKKAVEEVARARRPRRRPTKKAAVEGRVLAAPGGIVRRRLDVELVRRGLVSSRTRAVEAIDAGRVTVGGAPTRPSARQVDEHEPIVRDRRPAALRLARRREARRRARARSRSTCTGARALDAGASTGGFTDCLLQRGAARGRGRRRRPRAARLVAAPGCTGDGARADEPARARARRDRRRPCCGRGRRSVVHLAALVAPALARLTTPDAELVLLVKPQFEAGRERVEPGRHRARPDGAPSGARRGGRRARAARARRRRGDAVAAARRRRQHRVPGPRAQGRRRPSTPAASRCRRGRGARDERRGTGARAGSERADDAHRRPSGWCRTATAPRRASSPTRVVAWFESHGVQGADPGVRRGRARAASRCRSTSSPPASTSRCRSAATARCCARSTWSTTPASRARRERRPARLPRRGRARRPRRRARRGSLAGDYAVADRMVLAGRRSSRPGPRPGAGGR